MKELKKSSNKRRGLWMNHGRYIHREIICGGTKEVQEIKECCRGGFGERRTSRGGGGIKRSAGG